MRNSRKSKVLGYHVLMDQSLNSIALRRYRELHAKYPRREFYYVHTDRPELDILERQWVGIRRGNAVRLER